MAYVPKCSYDVFLSYAHEDNPPGDPWVDEFKQALETSLRQNLPVCCGDRRLQVWQDRERLKPGFSLSQEIRKALGRTAAVISLCSPNYFVRAYCADEIEEFQKHCGTEINCETSSRLINVIIRSGPEVERFAAGDCLYANLSGPDGPLEMGSDLFRKELAKLVRALKALLEAMRKKAPKVYVSLPRAGDDTDSKRLISEKTEKLLGDLSQWGYARTTEFHPAHYSDAQLQEEISGSLLSVHLVAEPSDPLERRQIDAAVRAGVPMLVWLAETAHGDRGGWIAEKIPGKNREYSEDAFPVFCDRVKEVLEKPKNLQVLPSASGRAKKVFIVRHPHADGEATHSLRDRLQSNKLSADFAKGLDWDAIDGVLVYQQTAPVKWFKDKLRYLRDMPLVKAVCPVSPPDNSDARRAAAEDFDFKPPSEVDARDPRILLDGPAKEQLQPFIKAVLGGAQSAGASSQEKTNSATAGEVAAPEFPET